MARRAGTRVARHAMRHMVGPVFGRTVEHAWFRHASAVLSLLSLPTLPWQTTNKFGAVCRTCAARVSYVLHFATLVGMDRAAEQPHRSQAA